MKPTFKSNIISVTVNGSNVAVNCKDLAGRNAVHAKILNNKTALGAFSKCAIASNTVTYTFDTSASASSFASKIDEVRETWKNVIIAFVTGLEIYDKDWVRVKCDSKENGKLVEPIISAHIPSLGFSYIRYVDGGNKKDFRYKFSSTTEAARFLTVLENIRNGKEVSVAMPFEESATPEPAPRQTVAATTEVRTLPTVKETATGNVIVTASTPTGTQETELTQTEVEQMPKNSTADTVNKKTLVIAAVAGIAVLLAIILLLKR